MALIVFDGQASLNNFLNSPIRAGFVEFTRQWMMVAPVEACAHGLANSFKLPRGDLLGPPPPRYGAPNKWKLGAHMRRCGAADASGVLIFLGCFAVSATLATQNFWGEMAILKVHPMWVVLIVTCLYVGIVNFGIVPVGVMAAKGFFLGQPQARLPGNSAAAKWLNWWCVG